MNLCSKTNELLSRLRASASWLTARPWVLWPTILCLIILLPIILLFLSHLEQKLRFAGMVFQLYGVLTVWLGILETRKLFGHPGLISKLRKWLNLCPIRKKNYVLKAEPARYNIFGNKIRFSVTANVKPDATSEECTKVLEKNMVYLGNRIDEVEKEMDQRLGEQNDLLKQEQQSRIEESKKLSALLESAETGGLDVSAMGAISLVIGVILSTIAPEFVAIPNPALSPTKHSPVFLDNRYCEEMRTGQKETAYLQY